MNNKESKINLFEYTDYRKFLTDWYNQSKKERGSVSFRTFSKRAGFKSTNIFKLVMEGERNLTEESIAKFAQGLKLNKQETQFFRNLVYLNQAQTMEQKDFYYKSLLQSKKFNQLKPIEKHQYDYYSSWYHPVVRELACSKEFNGTVEWLVKKIYPRITLTQAQHSLELLSELGFIKKIGNQYHQANALITTGPESSSIALHNYHQNMLSLAKELLPQVDASQRDVSALTLGVAQKRIEEIKKKIQEFREDILKLVSQDIDPEQVVALTIQLFPLIKEEGTHTL